jgi:ABC-type Zn2+ transport system substrate-binding protein/surface adhesin
MKYIKTEKDLLKFLKQISKDSFLNEEVALSKDPFEEKFNDQEDKNDDLFEQEEEEAEEEEEEESEEESEEEDDSDEDEEDDSDEEDDDDGMTPAAKKALSLPTYESGSEVSFDQIITAINLVRAGNSTKDKKTKNEIKDYYERLDSEEKAILLIFLREFAKIMTGAVEGDDAQDPSDPKAYFDIISTKKKEDDESEEETTRFDRSQKNIQ